jgi:predicted nucleotidyltransferase
MEPEVDLDAVRATLRHHGVVFALLFGSHATGQAIEGSDVDVAVWAGKPVDTWALRGALPAEVDLVDLAGAPDGLAGRIALTGLVVLDDDPRARIRWQADSRKRHLDEAFRRDQFRADFVAAHR